MHRQKNVVTVQILVHACFSSSNDNLKSKVSFPARPPTADLRHGRRLGRPARLRPDMEKHRHADITCTWPRSLLLPQCLSQAPDTAFLFLSIFCATVCPGATRRVTRRAPAARQQTTCLFSDGPPPCAAWALEAARQQRKSSTSAQKLAHPAHQHGQDIPTSGQHLQVRWVGVSDVPRPPPLCLAHGPRPPSLFRPGQWG